VRYLTQKPTGTSASHRSRLRMDASSIFTCHRALELHAFLVDFVNRSSTPVAHNSIVLIGRPFTSAWIISLLVHAALYHDTTVDISRHLHRVVAYGMFRFSIASVYSPPLTRSNVLCSGHEYVSHQILAAIQRRSAHRGASSYFPELGSGCFNHPDIDNYIFEKTPPADPLSTLTSSPLGYFLSSCISHRLIMMIRKPPSVFRQSRPWQSQRSRSSGGQGLAESGKALYLLQQIRVSHAVCICLSQKTSKVSRGREQARWDQPDRAFKGLLVDELVRQDLR
jgi:hypothetical protein